MATRVTYQFKDKTTTIPMKNGMIDGLVRIEVNGIPSYFNFKDDKLSGENSYQEFKFQDNNLVLNNETIEPESDGSWLLLDTNELLSLDRTSFDLIKRPIKFPENGSYSDSMRNIHFKDGKHDEEFNFIQIIRGKKLIFHLENGKIVQCDHEDLIDGFSERYKLLFTYDPEKFQIKYEPREYPVTGRYSDETKWINFYQGKISMIHCVSYSMYQVIDGKKWYFKIDDNKILAVGYDETCYNLGMKPVQEDGTCPELKKKFTLDLDKYEVIMEDLPEIKYPFTGHYSDETKWINFYEGKISMHGYLYYSMHQIINNRRWCFRIDENKIFAVGYDDLTSHDLKMRLVQEDGTCPELNKKFTLDLNKYEIIIEDLPAGKWIKISDCTPPPDTKESSVVEMKKNGYIKYFFINGFITRKEYYCDDKLKKVKYIN